MSLPIACESAAGPAAAPRRLAFTPDQEPTAEQLTALIRGVSGIDREWREKCLGALLQLGPAAAPAVLDALRGTVEMRRGAVEVLGRLTDDFASRPLIEAVSDSDSVVREKAVQALGRIGDPAAVPALCAALTGPDVGLRWHAADVLGRMRDPRAVPAFAESLKDADRFFREKVVRVLEQFGEAAVPLLESLLRDRDTEIHRLAAEALGRLNDPRALTALWSTLKSGAVTARRNAAEALGESTDHWAVAALTDGLRDPDVGVRCRSAASLGKLRKRRGAAVLCAALQDPEPEVRLAVVDALIQTGAPSVSYLAQTVQTADEQIAMSAASVLAEIGAASIPALLVILMGEAPTAPAYAGTQPFLRRSSVHGLHPRGYAAEALGVIATRCPDPSLRAALPRLRTLAGTWSLEPDAAKTVYRRALARIEAATEALKDLPLPGIAGTPDGDALPVPAGPEARAPHALPLPAQPAPAEEWGQA